MTKLKNELLPGQKLREARLTAGLTMAQVAKKLGDKSKQYINIYENGHKHPSIENTRKILQAMDFSEKDASKYLVDKMFIVWSGKEVVDITNVLPDVAIKKLTIYAKDLAKEYSIEYA